MYYQTLKKKGFHFSPRSGTTYGMAMIITFFLLSWYLSLFMQTFFLHRYAAHKMFTMSPKTEKIFFLLTWLFQGPSYLSANTYAILHRMHHAHTDTQDDPHSPSYDRSIFAMMWRTAKIYGSLFTKKVNAEPRYTRNLPTWDAFDRFAGSWPSRIGWIVLYFTFYLFAAPPLWMYALLPIQCVIGPVHGAIINWCAHKWGYRNFKTNDTSKNFLPVDLLMLGESYHNNHHANQKSPNFGVRFFEIDLSYLVIRLLHRLKVIKLADSI
jgi:stearoyl-CoA desaturase (delta-9 desaturase)